ncbi:UPF0172-domain-containing protein [Dacryopinax primogenitus]|uniref:UPF0172-domain-containing protein n=1 Tax=Dacryopinax primogenitus (strain DJM 731) TaxID=1858805 RepID=M5FXM2_DACPD|nr:UPF0172-domain-containing protein [Dacryopinax primogenitus]EJT98251.1 UPF0172-domain-containing protein [Dacryopinax primogenitus]
MAPQSYTISSLAYLKVLLHATKYPTNPVNGVLLTTSPSGAADIEVSDAVPLLHHWTSLSPMMEIGLDLAGGFAEDNGLRIIGYYEASDRADEKTLGPIGDRIVSKIKATSPDAIALVLDAAGLSMGEAGLIPYIASPSLKIIPNSFTSRPPSTRSTDSKQVSTFHLAAVDLPRKALGAIKEQSLQNELGDFDDHLEDVRIDWLKNPKVTAAVEKL